MSDIEWAIWAMIIIFFGLKILTVMDGFGTEKDIENIDGIDSSRQEKEREELNKKIEGANFKIEGLLLKKEKIEAKIEKIEFDSSLDFENEREINIEIRELKRDIEIIDKKINKLFDEINNFNLELDKIGTYEN